MSASGPPRGLSVETHRPTRELTISGNTISNINGHFSSMIPLTY